MRQAIRALLQSARDLAPILAVILFFQWVVIGEPMPHSPSLLIGLCFVLLGLSLFVQGLEQGLFPLGERMAYEFARKGSLPWLLAFAFLLGFSTTIAEPALIAIADKASEIAAVEGMIAKTPEAMQAYAYELRLVVALSVGCAIALGVLRILLNWPLHLCIIFGYFLVMVETSFAPRAIIGIAYDAGGVTTSTITVPLVTALGVGLASSIQGRNPLVDGFGLIAFASLFPMLFVMAFGILKL